MLKQNNFPISSVGKVQSICKPIFAACKLISFTYARLYPDNSLLAVHSDPGFADLHLELNCSPMPLIPLDFWQSDFFYFLPKDGDDKKYNNLLKQSNLRFNCDDPLYIINRISTYTEVAVFGSYLDDKFAVTRYLNELNTLSDFVKIFRNEIDPIFEQGQDSRLYLSESLFPQVPEFYTKKAPSIYTDFYQRILNKTSLGQFVWNNISQREMQCLYYLCKGYRYKDIGNQLFISERTVETHITNARQKLDMRTRSQMIKTLTKLIE